MAAAVGNLVWETSTTTGTGNLTTVRNGGYARGSEAFGTSDLTTANPYVFIINRDAAAAEWEIRQTYWSAAGTLVRSGSPTLSSNSNNAVDFGAGTKDVTSDIPAALQIRADGLQLGFQNAELSLSVGSSALTIALKTAAGTDPSALDPVTATFRNATAATGDLTSLQITAATSLVISSGSTMGFSSGVVGRLWIVGFYDAGTFRLGAINCLSGVTIYPLSAWGIASSTAEGGAGAADSAQVFYTGTAVTSKPYIVLGYATWETGLTTAGTWDATPTRLQLFGHGVRLPGTRVQYRGAADSTGFSTTSSTYQTSTLTVAITPTSAANPVRVQIGGNATTATSGVVVFCAIFRDATRVSGPGYFKGDGTSIYNSIGTFVTDTPRSTSSITYSAKTRNDNNTNSVQFPGTDAGEAPYGVIIAEEIMA